MNGRKKIEMGFNLILDFLSSPRAAITKRHPDGRCPGGGGVFHPILDDRVTPLLAGPRYHDHNGTRFYLALECSTQIGFGIIVAFERDLFQGT